MSRYGKHVVRYTRYIAADILRPIVDPRIVETQERSLYELACTDGHHTRIFSSDTKLDVVEIFYMLEEGPGVSENLTRSISANSVV